MAIILLSIITTGITHIIISKTIMSDSQVRKLCTVGNLATQTEMYTVACTSIDYDRDNHVLVITDSIKNTSMVLDLTNLYVKTEKIQ
jgi:hypothetical protein